MDYKKIAKYAGKTAATIVCPPLGFALWPKKAEKRLGAAAVGLVVSGMFNVGILSWQKKQVYDNISVIGKTPVSVVNWGEIFSSPIAFYFDAPNKTRLKKVKKSYFVQGDDVVTFNNGKYNLNFSSERKFGSFAGKSVAQAQEQVKMHEKQFQEKITKYEKILEAYLKQGSLLDARRERENLDKLKLLKQEKLGKLEANLEAVTKEYIETKTVFQEAVDKMNSELECLAQGKN